MARRERPLKGRQFTADVILWAVRWYLQFPISYRDLEFMLRDRGVSVDHTTLYRWIQAYAAEPGKRLRPHLRPTTGSWRVDEAYLKVKGRWVYLYRAVDDRGQTIDFRLSARRDAQAAKRFFRKALARPNTANPRTITVDKNAADPKAVADLKRDKRLWRFARLRQVKYLNNIVEQDHRRIKGLVRPGLGFKRFRTAWRPLVGYGTLAMMRKGQVGGIGGDDIVAQAAFVNALFDVAAWEQPEIAASLPSTELCNRTEAATDGKAPTGERPGPWSMRRTGPRSAPLGLPGTVVDAPGGVPGELGGRLGDPGAAVQQKVDLRRQQVALGRGEVLRGGGAHHAVAAVDGASHGALGIVGPLPHDRLEATGHHSTDPHQDVQVLLGVPGYFLGSPDLPGEHLAELVGGSPGHLLAGIGGIAGSPRSGLASAFRHLAYGFAAAAAGLLACLRGIANTPPGGVGRVTDRPCRLVAGIPGSLARGGFPRVVRHHQLLG
jgi:transposase-like protein